MMIPELLPEDMNVEILLSYLPEYSCKVSFKGLHKRNAYMDIVDIEKSAKGDVLLYIGRNSLYNSLPEFMFHPINRFDNISQSESRERFAEEYEKQEKEKEDACKFFAPIDTLLLQLRLKVRDSIQKYTSQNKILQDILGDELTEIQQRNRFISQAIPYLPYCKNIRGNRMLITFLLRKIFMEEGVTIERRLDNDSFSDEAPRYNESLGSQLDSLYVGNEFSENLITYNIYYWSDKECDNQFLSFIDDLEIFRRFIQDYFISIEEKLIFNIFNNEPPLRLSDTDVYNYLDYNTNI